ncbi:undecaprenyl-diphosphate phosphatase [Rhodobacteraceae bacterium WD3A24]|nr:undecaprenyl-diphosphate phosphatase [Rhodobacteraceae bacterium WD3A24]
MTLFHLFLVAAIQGLTEFLPVSSSAHLILLPQLTGMEDQGLAIDVAVHVGTLAAVTLYFRRDVAGVLSGLGALARGRRDHPGAQLALNLAIATLPVSVLGLVLQLTGTMAALRSIAVIGWAMIGFGLVLYVTDRVGRMHKRTQDWRARDAVILGLWQALALIPGTSRAGAAISGARLLGYSRHHAARLSMLMSIPTILAAGGLQALELGARADAAALRDGAIAAGLAFLAALAALALMMRLLQSVSFTPYVIYRIVLGAALLLMAYG